MGGGILVHGLAPLHHGVEAVLAQLGGVGLVNALLSAAADALAGVVAGALVFAGLSLWAGLRRTWQRTA